MTSSQIERIEEIASHTSFLTALECNYITPEDLFRWILAQPLDKSWAMIAFLTLHHRVNLFEFVVDDKNLIKERAIFYDVFVVAKSEDEARVFCSRYSYDSKIIDEIMRIRIALQPRTNSDTSMQYNIIGMSICIHAGIWPFTDRVKGKYSNAWILSADWVSKVSYNNTLYKDVISRCDELKKKCPEYFRQRLRFLYSAVLHKCFQQGLFPEEPVERLLVCKYYDSLISDGTSKMLDWTK